MPIAHRPTILLVEDDLPLLRGLDRLLRARGYQTVATGDPDRARELMDLVPIDAVVTDLGLPMRDGRCFAADAATPTRHVPVLVITGHHDLTEVSRMLEGAMPRAVLPKPVREEELVRALTAVLRGVAAKDDGDPRVTRELAESMTRALALRDVETEAHARRVSLWTRRLAETLGLPPHDVFWAEVGALLHDIGKIGVPDAVLHKPGPLDEHEWAQMKRHTTLGAELLEPITRLHRCRDLVLHHHESWDGSGYPHGLGGEAIPLAARLFSPIDAYDAITSDRPYRRGLSHDEAMARLTQGAGTQFDPSVVDTIRSLEPSIWSEVRRVVATAPPSTTATAAA
jgi:putative two-component system response regulator